MCVSEGAAQVGGAGGGLTLIDVCSPAGDAARVRVHGATGGDGGMHIRVGAAAGATHGLCFSPDGGSAAAATASGAVLVCVRARAYAYAFPVWGRPFNLYISPCAGTTRAAAMGKCISLWAAAACSGR